MIQIGLLNIADKSDNATQNVNFLHTDKNEMMEIFDQFLSEKVNVDVVKNVVEVVRPAIVAHVKQIIHTEAVKICSAFNSQENINSALLHLLAAEKSPEKAYFRNLLQKLLVTNFEYLALKITFLTLEKR